MIHLFVLRRIQAVVKIKKWKVCKVLKALKKLKPKISRRCGPALDRANRRRLVSEKILP
jgi:hypothetical protein